jgi:hypothetical protein
MKPNRHPFPLNPSTKSGILRILKTLLGLSGVIVFLIQAYLLLDLRPFEYSYILTLLGGQGIAFLAFLDIGFAFIVWRFLKSAATGKPVILSGFSKIMLGIWVLAFAWLMEWTFMETPVTVHIAQSLAGKQKQEATIKALVQQTIADSQHSSFNKTMIDVGRYSIMHARIVMNRKKAYQHNPLISTIEQYSQKYGVNRTLLFYWAYLDSFYGEAVSGPAPFFAEMTSETFRDIVQAHLPWWFIESRVRIRLIEKDYLERLFGSSFGHKLRYALQKATYDISVDPYDTNTFADVLLVMQEYEPEFSDILKDRTSPLNLALQNAYFQIKGKALLKPYDKPYVQDRCAPSFYMQNREALITYSRAIFYKMVTDFDFATRVQSLVAKYYMDVYSESLGRTVWDNASEFQKQALLSIIRDVYTPSIGKLSYNIYMLPEFNCMPVDYVVTEIRQAPDVLDSRKEIWRTSHPDYLWGAATTKLNVLGEVWHQLIGAPIPHVPETRTTEDAISLLAAYN